MGPGVSQGARSVLSSRGGVVHVDDVGVPSTFERSVGANVGGFYGGGRLLIEPGIATLLSGPVLQRITGVERIVHTRTTIEMIRTRIAPPWLSTCVVLEDDDHVGTAAVGRWGVKRLLRALGEAGFQVNQRRTWFSLGGGRSIR